MLLLFTICQYKAVPVYKMLSRKFWFGGFRRGSRGDVAPPPPPPPNFHIIHLGEQHFKIFGIIRCIFVCAFSKFPGSLRSHVIISNSNESIFKSRHYPSTISLVILKSQDNICIPIYFLHLCRTTTPLKYSSTLPSCCESVKVQMHVQCI